jgi:glycosyltransferase involved in cell wall biosynthesis
MLGVSSARKRLDLALDIAAGLARADRRFRLLIKSAQPREEKWVWDQADERDYFASVLPRIETEPLADIVTWEGFGRDVASWLRNIGFVLSLSDDESFHLAPAEGMATGAIPIIRNWPGADTVYAKHWVLTDTDEMIERIVSLARDADRWERESQRARDEAVTSFGLEAVVARWAATLGDPR